MNHSHSSQIKWYYIFYPLIITAIISACVHEPVLPMLPDDPASCDTTFHTDTVVITDTVVVTPPDTTQPGDTTQMTFKPCNPDSVYFSRDILPILISNCAKSGCHDATSAQDNVVLTEYSLVIQTGDVVPGNLFESDLYEVLVETDPDDKMPPPPNAPLSNDQILLVQKWILQGAQNLTCEDSIPANGCDTIDVSFSQVVDPILTTHCKGCHNSNGASGGINLSNHSGVASAASSGRLYGAAAHINGYTAMPQGGAKLPECDIKKIKAWIDDGAMNN